MFDKILIANRGAIACRIIRTCRRLGIGSVAVYTKADISSLHVDQADEAICIGEARATDTYLDQCKVLDAARRTGCGAIHPGYGFLSENAAFAEACEAAAVAFIGPRPEHIADFGLKHRARELARTNDVPLLPGSGLLADVPEAVEAAAAIGYPVMLKSTAGGGGIGMRLCADEATLQEAFAVVRDLGAGNFGDGGLFLEKYISRARHIEVQIFGDGLGGVAVLGERDCSLQRRNQKVVEETPAPGIGEAVRERLFTAARSLGEAVRYRSAGTVEFLYDAADEAAYFLEVNTRLQVEHGVTEEVTGIDLVEWMIRLAAGETAFLEGYRYRPRGHAVQARLYAEDPGKQFQPAAGMVSRFNVPASVRCETWVAAGTEISPWYDPMLAKIIATGADRSSALARMVDILDQTCCDGPASNLEYLRRIFRDEAFLAGTHSTRTLDQLDYRPRTVDVLDGGTHTTLQDYPGRTGYWHVGVPPSGPMDSLAFRLGNSLLGNPPGAAGLELVFSGPTLRFNAPARVVLAGALMQAEINGSVAPYWTIIQLARGDVLKLCRIAGGGARAYLLVEGGIEAPDYLGSKSTFTLGRFGGISGDILRPGDVLRIPPPAPESAQRCIPLGLVPEYPDCWQLHVVYGPHGSPDFFTPGDIDTFFTTDWEVHFNSSRTGVRLIGPAPDWAREDGGEAGLHPSNLHDNAYAVGSVDFTGDMPVILGPDGPSLGGFVCPATVVKADLWKLGQLKPGDRIRFLPVDIEIARDMEQRQLEAIATLKSAPQPPVTLSATSGSPVIRRTVENAERPAITYRPSGEDNLLVEYGPMVLDLNLRFRVHALMQWLSAHPLPGILELTPGVRSLQVHYDSLGLHRTTLLDHLARAEDELEDVGNLEVPVRIVHLPLSWDDAATRLAIEKYTRSVRRDAPWCPSNIEFIRRINGLDSVDAVKEIVYSASYLVMGLGDVYLGAPVATPLDPRHRLVTTKYNPARTWTPENAVGIGGSYLCVYGMEGPGGYQFVGRTLQMWNRYRETERFEGDRRWLLRFFDQIRFFPVTGEELRVIREDFPLGRYHIDIEETRFNLGDYNRFLVENAGSIEAFRAGQQSAFAAERQRWEDEGLTVYSSVMVDAGPDQDLPAAGENEVAAPSPMPGSVWKILVEPGETVRRDQSILILESMKMEIQVPAPAAGVITRLLCREGDEIRQGQSLAMIDTTGGAREAS